MKTIKSAAVVLGILIASIGQSFCQTNLRFTGTSVTREGAIHLAWSSVSNEVYEIDEADSVIDANIGNTTWNPLYNNYPSQGTNTFWLDTGNYNLNPQILHPKNMPMRFYRVVDQGPDSLLDKPTVLINVLTNNTVVSNEVTFTVTAATDQPGNQGTILYVDGQEMQAADTSTNYTVGSTNYETDTYSLNTCEWFNGPHVIFATTEAASSFSSQINSGPLVTAHAVSPFVTLLFTNLIEEISFSQPSFDPALGETQRISAVFAADCNWTLNIEDIYTNLVFTTNGSGISMSYNWDGNGNGETNLPAGIYFYYITAATNGLTPGVVIGGSSGGSGGTLPSPDSVSGASELWVVSPDSENVVPLALYPPGFDTNGITIFEATPSEVQSLTAAASSAPSSLAMDSSSVSGASPDFASSSGQSSPPSPQRPPNNPIRGTVGAIGVAGDTFTANGTNGFSTGPLDDGLNIGSHISMEGNPAGNSMSWPPRPEHRTELTAFVKTMQYYGWKNPFNEVDNQLSISQMRGSGTPFNNVDMGVFTGHGTYGTSIDYAANGCMQMYFPITSGGSAQYLRLSEMNLGGPTATNGLKWMIIDACHSLYHVNWSSMNDAGVYPYNGNLHLLLGGDTTTWTNLRKWSNFAKYMNYGKQKYASPQTIRNAYYQGNVDAFQNAALPSGTTITLAVAGDSACLDDSLQTNTPPSGSWQYDSLQIYPY